MDRKNEKKKPPVPNPYLRKINVDDDEKSEFSISDYKELAFSYGDESDNNSEKGESTSNATIASTGKESNNQVLTNSEGHVEFWKRLPSTNLSFGSAEILTVGECLEHKSTYALKAVRVTGMLKVRNLQPNNSTILELVPPTKEKVVQVRGTKKTSNVLNSNKRKRPWFPVSAKKKVPQPTNITTINTLKVLAGPTMPHLDSCTVGSLVMVIGTMMDDGCIHARILRLVTHSDITLHLETLKARRKLIYRRRRHEDGGNGALQGCGPPPYDAFESKG